MGNWLTRGLLFSVLVAWVVSGRRAEAQPGFPPPPVVSWPSDTEPAGMLESHFFIDRATGRGRFGSSMSFTTVSPKFAAPGARVRVPFHAHYVTDVVCPPDPGGNNATTRFRAIALRHPVLPAGAPPAEAVQIGEGHVDLHPTLDPAVEGCVSRGDAITQDVDFVMEMNLPGVNNAVEIVAQVDWGPQFTDPPNPPPPPPNTPLNLTRHFPSDTCATPGLDSSCLLAGVMPTGVFIPSTVPMTVLYEPPGNCSWAVIKDNHNVGMQMTLTQGQNDTTQTIVDVKLAGQALEPGSNTVEQKIDRTSRSSIFSFGLGFAVGTDNALQPSNPGNVDCLSPAPLLPNGEPDPATDPHPVPSRAGISGPGLGDYVFFVVRPRYFYWNTENLSNFRYTCSGESPVTAGCGVPEVDQSTETTAQEFAVARDFDRYFRSSPIAAIRETHKDLLPAFLQGLSDAELQGLARIDPFIQKPVDRFPPIDLNPDDLFDPDLRGEAAVKGCLNVDPRLEDRPFCVHRLLASPIDPRRYGKVGVPQCFIQDVTVEKESTATGSIFGASSLSAISRTEPGATLKTVVSGGAFVASKVLKLFGVDASAGDIEKGYNVVGYVDNSSTTLTKTNERNQAIDTTSSDRFGNYFHFQHKYAPHAGMQVYYDRLFGTMAFRSLPGCTGGVRAAFLSGLPGDELLHGTRAVVGRPLFMVLSQGNRDILTQFNEGSGFTFSLVTPDEYDVPERVTKGLPPGMALDPASGTVFGTPGGSGGQQFQSLVLATGSNGSGLALLWVNILLMDQQAACFTPTGPVVCTDSSLENGERIRNCCSSPGCCTNQLSLGPPHAVCAARTVCTQPNRCSAAASIDNGSFDPDGNAITLASSPAGPYPRGTTPVTLLVSDGPESASCAATVTVNDCQAPTIACPAPRTVECTGSGTNVAVTPTGSDNCGPPALGCTPSGSFPLGTTAVTCNASDGAQSATCTTSVRVVDTTRPVLRVPADVTISVCTGKGLDIGMATATDACGAVTITSDRPTRFPLGATTVTWTATDGAGNRSTATQRVTAVLDDDSSCCPAGTNVIVGTSGSDQLVGTSGSDCILGRGGDDVIDGRDGNDFIAGGAGNDVIFGGNGNDRIFGGAGNDTINAAPGSNVIDGGDGTDTCAVVAGQDTAVSCP
jgi:hypothetical protein